MRDERGFTLIEMVVAVAIATILVVGSVWLFAAHPGALRAAVDGFDANYADARALAAKTGNGATIVFAPRKDPGGNAIPGFTMRVYAGRPNAANAVSATNAAAVIGDATISETTFGSPPFAIFLSSAGKPSGTASYPAFDGHGNPQFTVIAQQPPCPAAGSITLTFRANNGSTDSRKLGCDGVMPSGTAAPQPTLTPEALRIDTPLMVAHWTGDVAPLHFKVGEFGYRWWFASNSGVGCDTSASDSGAPAASFPSPYPYALGSEADMSAAPAPPNTPYTWAVQTAGHPPDQPPGSFAPVPSAGNGGVCTVRIDDSYGQEVDAHIQVMGDITPRSQSLSMKVGDPPVPLTFGKTFDSEALTLQFGGPCGGIVSATQTGGAPAASVSTQQTTAVATITAQTAGSCDLQIGDQYGEPVAIVHINVQAKRQAFATWPAYLELGEHGAAIGTTDGNVVADAGGIGIDSFAQRLGPVLNAILGGGVARAATGACYAHALTGPGGGPDTSAPQSTLRALGVAVADDGCLLDASSGAAFDDGSGNKGAMVAFEPSGNTGNFQPTNQCSNVILGSWAPSLGRNDVQARLSIQGASAGQCAATFTDGESTQTPTADNGLVAVKVATPCVAGVACALLYQSTGGTDNPDCSGLACNPTGPGDCGSDGPKFKPCPGGGLGKASELFYEFDSTDGGNTWVQSANRCGFEIKPTLGAATAPCSLSGTGTLTAWTPANGFAYVLLYSNCPDAQTFSAPNSVLNVTQTAQEYAKTQACTATWYPSDPPAVSGLP